MKRIPRTNLPTEIVQVNDGEALLCQIKSLLRAKFSDIYKLHEKHLYIKYGYCYVVFDFYGNGPSTKDTQYTKEVVQICQTLPSYQMKKCVKSQDDFLDNQNNKARFIPGLSNHLS